MSAFIGVLAFLVGFAPVPATAKIPLPASDRSLDQAAAATQPSAVTSRLQIRVPREDAELLIEDTNSGTTGQMRELATPPLEPGRMYEYRLTARWRPNSYTLIVRRKTVQFRAGDDLVVDLTQDDPADRAEIRYVPTPDSIVAELIGLADLKPGDVVFEPGCGDARITIAALKAGVARGVGIDIDPERVAESRANVRAAGLENRIEIRLGDALDIKDLSEASVVFLYMGDEFNMLLRPLLWKQLKVGARVVSHRFRMGDWEPDRTITIDSDEDYYYQLHLWTITPEVKRRAEQD